MWNPIILGSTYYESMLLGNVHFNNNNNNNNNNSIDINSSDNSNKNDEIY